MGVDPERQLPQLRCPQHPIDIARQASHRQHQRLGAAEAETFSCGAREVGQLQRRQPQATGPQASAALAGSGQFEGAGRHRRAAQAEPFRQRRRHQCGGGAGVHQQPHPGAARHHEGEHRGVAAVRPLQRHERRAGHRPGLQRGSGELDQRRGAAGQQHGHGAFRFAIREAWPIPEPAAERSVAGGQAASRLSTWWTAETQAPLAS